MKIGLLSLVISMCMCLTASAQSNKATTHWSLGPNIGFGGTWIDNFSTSKYKPAYNAGIAVIYSTKSSFGVGADVKYSFEGGKREYATSVAGVNAKEEADLNYLRIPIKAMWFFGTYGHRVRPKVALGPSFGFLMGGKTELTNTTSTGAVASSTTFDSKNYWDNFDLALTGSAGFNYRLVKYTWLTVDVSYLHGLTDARKDDKRAMQGYNASSHYKNRNLQLNLGVNFGL